MHWLRAAAVDALQASGPRHKAQARLFSLPARSTLIDFLPRLFLPPSSFSSPPSFFVLPPSAAPSSRPPPQPFFPPACSFLLPPSPTRRLQITGSSLALLVCGRAEADDAKRLKLIWAQAWISRLAHSKVVHIYIYIYIYIYMCVCVCAHNMCHMCMYTSIRQLSA